MGWGDLEDIPHRTTFRAWGWRMPEFPTRGNETCFAVLCCLAVVSSVRKANHSLHAVGPLKGDDGVPRRSPVAFHIVSDP